LYRSWLPGRYTFKENEVNRTTTSGITACIIALTGTMVGQEVEATIGVGRLPSAVVYDSVNSKLYVANQGSSTVSVIDTNNQVVAEIAVGGNPSALCWNPVEGRIYVASCSLANAGRVTVVSTTNDSIVTSFAVGEHPNGLVWNPVRNKVYCTNYESATVSAIDCPSNQILATVNLSQRPNGISYNQVSDLVYVSSGAWGQPGRIHVVDCGDDDLTATLNSGSNAYGLAHNPLTNRLYVTNRGSDNLSVFNCANNQNLGMLPAGQEPRCVLWTPTNKVFWAGYWDYSIRWMHGDSLRARHQTTLTAGVDRFLYNAVTKKLFAACPLASKVVVLDARDQHELRVITEIETGGGPSAMAVCPSRNRVYVANAWDTTVTVIQDVIGIAEPETRLALPSVTAKVRPTMTAPGGRVDFVASGFVPDRLVVRDALGRVVHESAAGARSRWTAEKTTGLYFYTMSNDRVSASGKLVVR